MSIVSYFDTDYNRDDDFCLGFLTFIVSKVTEHEVGFQDEGVAPAITIGMFEHSLAK